GVVVTAALLHACFLWVRRCAGTRAGWISIPVVLLLFGPAHVIWAGDLTFQGFLYASFYPQTLALAFLLYTLVLLHGEAETRRVAIAIMTAAATMVVHPFTGALLALLLAAEGAWRALRGGEWLFPSLALVVGYAIAARWPAYSLDHALAVAGPRGVSRVGGWVSASFVVRLIARTTGLAGFLRRVRTSSSDALVGNRVLVRLAIGGLVLVGLLATWQVWLLLQPLPDPIVHSNRLA